MNEAITPPGLDEHLRQWMQGDCVLGDHYFLFATNVELPLTPDACQVAAQGYSNVESQVDGFAVVSQTCDIVRNHMDRPFLEVCPLVKVDQLKLAEIKRLRRPGYAYIPGLAHLGLVADLDRTMTFEKGVIMKWDRVPGCGSQNERVTLSRTLGRKRTRMAFPDDFTELCQDLTSRLAKNGKKDSPEGRAIGALSEIRVTATPGWSSDRISVFFWFIRDSDPTQLDEHDWATHVSDWLDLVETGGRFEEVDGIVTDLGQMTAADYVSSSLLDLDRLSHT